MRSNTEIVKHFKQNWIEELSDDSIAKACLDAGMTWLDSMLNPVVTIQIRPDRTTLKRNESNDFQYAFSYCHCIVLGCSSGQRGSETDIDDSVKGTETSGDSKDAKRAVLDSDVDGVLGDFISRFSGASLPAAPKPRDKTVLVAGSEAPELTAKDTDGEEFSLADYRGKIVMLDFWGDW